MHTHIHIYIILIISKCYCMLSFPKGFLSFLMRRQDTMNIFRTLALSMSVFHWLFCLKGSVPESIAQMFFSEPYRGARSNIRQSMSGTDKTESGIFLSHPFSIMLIFNNNSSMSLHGLILS